MKIGITTRLIKEGNVRKEFVNEEYLNLLNKYHLTPIVIPYTQTNLDELLSICDGFLIPGGDDVDSKYYHQENNPHNTLVDPLVDQLDFYVLDYAIKNNKKVLGFCRGLQVINVYFKGDLLQHIEDDSHKGSLDHPLEILEGSFIDSEKFSSSRINSFHHQKINKLGDGLLVDAISLQAIEIIHHNKYKILATQFHIEKMNDKLVDYLMNYFINL